MRVDGDDFRDGIKEKFDALVGGEGADVGDEDVVWGGLKLAADRGGEGGIGIDAGRGDVGNVIDGFAGVYGADLFDEAEAGTDDSIGAACGKEFSLGVGPHDEVT